MLKTLRISFSLRNTYRVNGVLHSLKQVPLIKHLLPDTIYQWGIFKGIANVLSVLWEIATVFLWKILYFATLVCGIGIFYERVSEPAAFLHILLFLTLVGSYMNSSLFTASRDKYYAIVLLRMDPRRYVLANYGYFLAKTVVGFLACTMVFGYTRGVPLWLCLIIPFGVAGAKLVMAADSLREYKKRGTLNTEKHMVVKTGMLTGLLMGLAYALPGLGIALPVPVSAAVWVLLVPAGLLSIRYILKFDRYREFLQEQLAQMLVQMDTMKNAAKAANEKSISTDTSITSQKSGFEYLNELFIKRHRKILWKSSLRITQGVLVIVAALLGLMAIMPQAKSTAQLLVLNMLPLSTFLMYMINRGTNFTAALFMNCDHSLLTYSFYKEPKHILKLFRIRLREIMKINALPAAVIGAGLCLILAFSGGTENPFHYVIIMVTILSLSLFFSIHYLTLYYLLQPYTAGTEMKSGTYQVAMAVTYLVCYGLIQVRLSIMAFGLACIAFCVIYSLVASMLVYTLAPDTFRIRS